MKKHFFPHDLFEKRKIIQVKNIGMNAKRVLQKVISQGDLIIRDTVINHKFLTG